MSKSTRDNNLAQDDDYLDESSDWSEAADDVIPQQDKSALRGRPKWKAIEEYWEQKRLKDALRDYPSEED